MTFNEADANREDDGKFGKKLGGKPEVYLGVSNAEAKQIKRELRPGLPVAKSVRDELRQRRPAPLEEAHDPVQVKRKNLFTHIDNEYGDVDAIRCALDSNGNLHFRGIKRGGDIEDWGDDTDAFHDCREIFESSEFSELGSRALEGYTPDEYGVYTIPNS